MADWLTDLDTLLQDLEREEWVLRYEDNGTTYGDVYRVCSRCGVSEGPMEQPHRSSCWYVTVIPNLKAVVISEREARKSRGQP